MTGIRPGQAILVTGASGAIGGEIAAQAAEQGAIVGVHGAHAERIDTMIARIAARAPGARLIALPADLREAEAPAHLVAAMLTRAGRIDALVHCATAGVDGVTGPFAGTEPARYGALAAQMIGIFEGLCHAALGAMAADGGGTIIGFAADSGRFAAPRQAVMAGAYAGIMGFVRNLAVEVARDGIRVHCIAPTFVANTPIFEAFGTGARGDAARRRAGLGLPTPEDIAPLVLFLCGPGAARITGQIISVNGGLNA